MVKKRIDWIDIAKGIAIILMVIGHIIPYNNLIVWIFSFHMPLFIILSGITYKIPKDKENLKINFKKYLKKLFLPYAITLLICTIIRVLKSVDVFSLDIFFKELAKYFLWGNGCDYNFLGINFTGVGPIWFLITLFFSKLIFDFINYKASKNNLITNIIIYSFCLLLGLEIGEVLWLPQGLDLVLIFLFYLYVGYLLKTQFDNLKVNKTLIFVIAFAIWGICLGMNMFVELAMRGYPLGLLSIIESLCASYCIIELCKIMAKNKYLNRFLTKVGIMSLTILCIHAIENFLINWETLNINLYALAFIRLVMILVLAFIFTLIKQKIMILVMKKQV